MANLGEQLPYIKQALRESIGRYGPGSRFSLEDDAKFIWDAFAPYGEWYVAMAERRIPRDESLEKRRDEVGRIISALPKWANYLEGEETEFNASSNLFDGFLRDYRVVRQAQQV